ncbi:MAG: cytochrome c [Steroidobacteraceae bacterium]
MRALTVFAFAALFAAPIVSSASDTADDRAATGAQLFASRCGMCHRAGGMGTGILARRPNAGSGLLEERKDLPSAFVKAVARAGVGNMPRIPRGEVSDAQLARIAAYLSREPLP